MEMQGRKWYRHQLEYAVEKLYLDVKFPCRASLLWFRGSKRSESRPVEVERGVAEVKARLSLRLNMAYEEGRFLPKKTYFHVYVHTEAGMRKAGSATYDPSEQLNKRFDPTQDTIYIECCPDKQARFIAVLSYRNLGEVEFDRISRDSGTSAHGQNSYRTLEPKAQQPPRKESFINVQHNVRLESKEEGRILLDQSKKRQQETFFNEARELNRQERYQQIGSMESASSYMLGRQESTKGVDRHKSLTRRRLHQPAQYQAAGRFTPPNYYIQQSAPKIVMAKEESQSQTPCVKFKSQGDCCGLRDTCDRLIVEVGMLHQQKTRLLLELEKAARRPQGGETWERERKVLLEERECLRLKVENAEKLVAVKQNDCAQKLAAAQQEIASLCSRVAQRDRALQETKQKLHHVIVQQQTRVQSPQVHRTLESVELARLGEQSSLLARRFEVREQLYREELLKASELNGRLARERTELEDRLRQEREGVSRAHLQSIAALEQSNRILLAKVREKEAALMESQTALSSLSLRFEEASLAADQKGRALEEGDQDRQRLAETAAAKQNELKREIERLKAEVKRAQDSAQSKAQFLEKLEQKRSLLANQREHVVQFLRRLTKESRMDLNELLVRLEQERLVLDNELREREVRSERLLALVLERLKNMCQWDRAPQNYSEQLHCLQQSLARAEEFRQGCMELRGRVAQLERQLGSREEELFGARRALAESEQRARREQQELAAHLRRYEAMKLEYEGQLRECVRINEQLRSEFDLLKEGRQSDVREGHRLREALASRDRELESLLQREQKHLQEESRLRSNLQTELQHFREKTRVLQEESARLLERTAGEESRLKRMFMEAEQKIFSLQSQESTRLLAEKRDSERLREQNRGLLEEIERLRSEIERSRGQQVLLETRLTQMQEEVFFYSSRHNELLEQEEWRQKMAQCQKP